MKNLRARIFGYIVGGSALLVIALHWLSRMVLTPYFAASQVDTQAIAAVQHQLTLVFLAVGGLGVLGGLALIVFLTKQFVRPIEDLTMTSDALAAGDLSARTHFRGTDEIGSLGRAVNRIADQLRDRMDVIHAEEARLRAVLNSMVEAVLVTDRLGRIVLYNEALTKIAGQDVLGRTAVEAIRSAELHELVTATLTGRPSTSGEFEVEVSAARKTFRAQMAKLPGEAGVVAVLHDITEVKLSDKVRRDFVANASHELRTPLTAIRGFAETLRDGAVDDPTLARRFLDTILEHTRRLARLTDDLLELSRSESASEVFELVPVDVTSAVRRVVRGLRPQAMQKGLELSANAMGDEDKDVPLYVLANERALDHVLVNLVDNALKYTDTGSVRVGLHPKGNTVDIEVIDTGPGIAAKHLPRLFERFYRIDRGRARDVGGTGLGLAIVKHFVQRMSGEVTVESELGVGTRFRVSLAKATLALLIACTSMLLDATSTHAQAEVEQYARAEALERASQPAQAVDAYMEVVAVAPSSRAARRAAERLRWLRARDTNNFVPLARLKTLQQKDRTRLRITELRTFESTLETLPSDALVTHESFLFLAETHLDRRELSDAERNYRKLIAKAAPSSTMRRLGAFGLARALSQSKSATVALEELKSLGLGETSEASMLQKIIQNERYAALARILGIASLILFLMAPAWSRVGTAMRKLIKRPALLLAATLIAAPPLLIAHLFDDASTDSFMALSGGGALVLLATSVAALSLAEAPNSAGWKRAALSLSSVMAVVAIAAWTWSQSLGAVG